MSRGTIRGIRGLIGAVTLRGNRCSRGPDTYAVEQTGARREPKLVGMDTPVKSRTYTPRNETKYLCGCGLSRTFPFCDGSQVIAKTQRLGVLVSCGASARSAPAGQVDGEDATAAGHGPDREGPA
jgi:CDGSH-type Zn-finger protein